MTRDELKAREWASVAIQFHQKAEDAGQKIPFPDLCFCVGVAHKRGEAPARRLVTSEGMKGMIPTPCPVISAKTQAARVKALGEALNPKESRND